MAVATRVIPVRRRVPLSQQLGPVAISVLLGAVVTLATVQSIVASNWARGLNVLVVVALGGLAVGALFAQLRSLPAALAHLLSAVLGAVWAVAQIGPLLGPALPTWKDQATELLIRTIILGRILGNGGTGEDLFLFIAVLSLLGWLLGYLTMWWLIRRGWAWRPLLLNAGVLFVNLTYASPKPPAILFYLFLAASLLLLVHQSYVSRAHIWHGAGIEIPELLGWRFVASGSVVVIALLALVTLFPTRITSAQVAAVWHRVRAPWQDIQQRWDKAFSNINAPSNAVGGGFAGRSLDLQGARSFGTSIVLEVEAVDGEGQPYADYWRATAYDRYNNTVGTTENTWSDTTGQVAAATLGLRSEEQARTPLPAGERMPQIDTVDREVVTQTVTIRQSFAQPTLFAATMPISASLPIEVKHTYVSVDGQIVANFSDQALFATQRNGVRSGTTYTVTSLVGAADKQSLRSAPTEYPEWIGRYLQLPDGNALSRVFARAQEVAGSATNPYDKAEAIQNHLRTLTYDEKIPFPPQDRDRVDWFLFDLQRGYCDYFASAMVLMLRSQGVPARVVSGYAGGEYNAEKGVFEVRQNVAHTWVEVYFPAYGWQRFEPTPAAYTSLPDRPEAPAGEGEASSEGGASTLLPDPRSIDLEELERRLGMLDDTEIDPERIRQLIASREAEARRAAMLRGSAIGGGVLILALAGVWWLRRPRGLGPAAAAFSRIVSLARWASLGPQDSTTPREFAHELARHMPAQRVPLQDLAAAYTRERYSGGKPVRAESVNRAWRKIRWPLVGTMVGRWVGLARRRPNPRSARRRRR